MAEASENPPHPPALQGAMTLRVRYCECDPMGVAHHAAYAPWLEMGRTELLRASGLSYAQLEARGVFLVVTRLEIRYRRPIVYDDVLEVRSRVVGGSRVKIEHEYELAVLERTNTTSPMPEGGIAAVASTTLACVGRDGRVQPLPEWLVAPGA
jgi:acyl-CoA thioester hydrolase